MHLPVSPQSFKYAVVRQTLLLLVLSVSGLAVFAETPDNTTGENSAAVAATQQPYGFPAWPQRPQFKKEVVPPPPPGPYMSSALNDYSFKRPTFGDEPLQSEQAQPANRNSTINSAMDMFSPDVPWPDTRQGEVQRSGRWMPENGYQYVNPAHDAVSAQQKAYGYDIPERREQGAQSRGMSMKPPRWMPSMGVGPDGSYGPYGGNRPGQVYNQSGNR